MAKVKKIPMRMCIGCQEMKPKKELIRVVKTPGNSIELDNTGKRAGRGAYICPSNECLQKAVKAKRMEKSLGQSMPPEVLDDLREKLVK